MYKPKRVFFEKKALEYPLGEKLYELFQDKDIETKILKSNRVTGIPGESSTEKYVEGKKTLVIRVRKNQEFQSCKPSAHYQLPLMSGCSAKCEYCYLNTRFGKKPYTTIYANVSEILDKAEQYIEKRKPEITYFESAATSDPIPFEPYTGSLAKTIEFIGDNDKGRLRLVTKFDDIDGLLKLKHNGHTTIRFSINSDTVINEYEHDTASLEYRIKAARKILDANYKLGFIIGPVITHADWKEQYKDMLQRLANGLDNKKEEKITFEVISHRFTSSAKNRIIEVFPKTTLPMEEDERKYKYGQFGYGKYVYKKTTIEEIKEFFKDNISTIFPKGEIEYII
ncbi:spore photoproduct lyase [Dethiothermospora halolimnae]|uniref:spore photoproduct lyase n=1 Tax=Dethiothermospora halolimnae TaxID=3114390 RepID=UPI003CCC2060